MGQSTFTTKLDLAAVEAACGGLRTWKTGAQKSLTQAISGAMDNAGPAFVHLRFASGEARVPLLLEDPAILGHRFNRWLSSVMQD